MGIAWNEISEKSNGGTERMCRLLERDLPADLLEQFQIIPSRVRGLEEDKLRIFWAHDLPGDPESDHLKNGGWKKFHKIVFVSYWQRDGYIAKYGIAPSKCAVIQNAIDPIEREIEDKDVIRLVYHTTPHRGLEILVPVFERLQEKHLNLTLDVFSSFDAYGWKERDQPYEKLFDRIKSNPHMKYHGFVDNEEVRKSLSTAHIFAYPSIWQETSCIALMEAMSAGLLCVHPDYAALPETSANWTIQYNWNEDVQKHAQTFYSILDIAIEIAKEEDESQMIKLKGQKSYADLFYNWSVRKHQWRALLESLLNEPREMPKEKEVFEYRV
jgi:UDP-glucose:(glucosyl)LPS alpha-1,2-glucosyltransferase